VYFYELHESDDELYSEVLLAHDVEFDESQFLEMVLEARSAVLGSFEEDTLTQAIANELHRKYDFVHIDDTRLTVAIRVSSEEGQTAATTVEERGRGYDDDDEDTDYRSLLVDLDVDRDRRSFDH
jgi:hypothetical protein